MTNHSTQKGFTIVETLVAITVLMIAIAGPLSVASKSLIAATTSRDQFTASYLAQESMEVIKNIRDNNLTPTPTWLSSPYSISLNTCTLASPCDASAIDPSTITNITTTTINGQKEYQLYMGANGYSHIAGSNPTTPFSRYFYLTQVSANEYSVTVVVNWYEGSILYPISVSSTIVNSPR